MRNVKLVVGLLLVAALAFWGYRKLFPPHEVVIRKLIIRAAETASIRPNDTGITKFASVNWLVNACTTDVELVLEGSGLPARSIQGREQLSEVLAAVRGMMQSLTIDLIDIGVEVDKDETGATAQFIVRVDADGFQDQIAQEFRVRLRRVEGDWKFQRIEPLASLGL